MSPVPMLQLNYDNLSVTESVDTSRNVKVLWINHPDPRFSILATYLGTWDELDQNIVRLLAADAEVKNHNGGQIPVRNFEHRDLNRRLGRFAMHAELVADGNIEVAKSSGLWLRQTPAKPGLPAEMMPPPLEMVHAGEGKMKVKSKKSRGAASCELQFTDGDVNDETAWRDGGANKHPNSIIAEGLTPGVEYHFRIREIGPNGRGPWSKIFTLRAL